MSESLTIAEAAKLAQVNAKTIRRAIKDGRLAATLTTTSRGPTYLVDVESLELLKGSLSAPRAGTPVRHGQDIQTAILEALSTQRDELRERDEAQAQRIKSLEDELRDTRHQLAQLHEQVIRALPAPKRPWWKLFHR